MSAFDDVRLVVTPVAPFDDTHEWEPAVYRTETRRVEQCKRCGKRATALFEPFGIPGWVRAYPEEGARPCGESEPLQGNAPVSA